MRYVTLLLAVWLLGMGPAEAQTTMPAELGAIAAYNYNMHDADFGGIPWPRNCCREYKDGNGNGYTAGLFYRMFFGTDWSVAARAVYADYSAKLEYWSRVDIFVYDPPNTGKIEATFNNSIRTNLQVLSIEPIVEYQGLGIVTPFLGVNLASIVVKEFTQQEYLLTPGEYEFIHGGRYNANDAGDIPKAPSGFFSLVTGVSARIPLWGGFSISPEVSYLHTFNDIMNASDWKPHAVRAGLAVQTTL